MSTDCPSKSEYAININKGIDLDLDLMNPK